MWTDTYAEQNAEAKQNLDLVRLDHGQRVLRCISPPQVVLWQFDGDVFDTLPSPSMSASTTWAPLRLYDVRITLDASK